MKQKRIFYLDFVRAAAMLCIVLYHFCIEAVLRNIGNPGGSLLYDINGINFGHIGVSLFFLLSGASLMIKKEEKIDWKQYYKKRFLAIYPTYWIAWAAAFLPHMILQPKDFSGVPVQNLIFTVVGMDGYLHKSLPNFYQVGEWFVGTIVLLYLIFPLLRMGVVYHPRILTAVVLAVYGIGMVYYPFAYIPSSHNFYMRIPDFMFGMLFMYYYRNTKESVGAFIGVGLILFAYAVRMPFGQMELIRYLLIGIGFFLVLRFIGEKLERFPVSSAVSWMSGVSYEVFLVHHITIIAIFRFLYRGISLLNQPVFFWLSFLPMFAVILILGKLLQMFTQSVVNVCGRGIRKSA